jgi:signal transduction histidine kinase
MSAAQGNVLVVDDDAAGRYLKSHILRRNGYRVAEAATGMDAIEQCCAAAPEVVLLDMRLPDVHGADVCGRIKAAHPSIAILQTSAAITSAQDRARALNGGADGFLVEPIEPEELLATVRGLLRLRGAEQALRRMNESLELLVAERTRELTEANRRLEFEISEHRKTEDVLWHTQKLEVVGQLTGGIAHDFNNLLAVIVGSMEMIRFAFQKRDEQLPREKILRMLAASETATTRATKLTQQLLAFARKSSLKFEVVALDEVVVACEPFLRRALGDMNQLALSFQPELWMCRIDAPQFEAAILNLVVNARDAMPDGGRLEVSTRNVVVDKLQASRVAELTDGDYVVVTVKDTGTGMDADVLAHAFEPFFTTKEVGKGTGLGLSQVYGFIKQSGGHVTIESQPGVGTAFHLYLPRCDDVQQVIDVNVAAAGLPPRGHETVLVVEDNAEVLELAVATISDLGYRVLTARDGPAALDVMRTDVPIDLLFSDIVMPGGINGFELIRQARGIRNDLKAIVTSGYANVHRPGTDRPDVPLLLKPYRRSDLAHCIRTALDRV